MVMLRNFRWRCCCLVGGRLKLKAWQVSPLPTWPMPTFLTRYFVAKFCNIKSSRDILQFRHLNISDLEITGAVLSYTGTIKYFYFSLMNFP